MHLTLPHTLYIDTSQPYRPPHPSHSPHFPLPQVWFLAEGRLQSVHLTVPRTLYIDTSQPDHPDLAAITTPVAKTLPGGSKPQTVLQVSRGSDIGL